MFQDPTGLLGAVVGELLHRVIVAAERAVEWPEYCNQLKQLLQSLEPLVAQITSQEALDGAHASVATRRWLQHLKVCLDEAASVLETSSDPKHRWHPFARARCGSRLLKTTQQIKDFLQSQAVIPVIGLLLQQMEATDTAARDLKQQVAQLNLGLEAQKLLTSEVIDKERIFYVLKNGVEGLSIMHLGNSTPSSSSGTANTKEFDMETLEAQPIPRFVFGMDTLNQQIQDVLLGSEQIADNDNGESNVTLNSGSKWVGVWARGGAGKTLLVQNAMNNPFVAAHFNSSVYSLVLGQSPDVVHLQSKLCSQITGSKFSDFESPLEGKTKLYNLLGGQRCLLILDDVWDEGVLDWFDVVSEEEGRILMTSRKRSVLQRVQATEICVFELSSENSMKLFCSHAFGRAEGIPDHLEVVSKNVVSECKGLPLSLKVVGCFLAGKMESHHWEMALHKLHEAEVLSTEYEVQLFHRLKLSYDDLGIYDRGGNLHKECFLYFAAFPEDEVIEAEHLIQLWAGDGLVGQQENVDPELEGYCILSVLIARSLIELEKGWSKDRSMPTLNFKIHDVLRDMGLYILQTGTETWEQRCLFKAGWQPPGTGNVLPQGWLSFGGGAIGGRQRPRNSGCNILQAQKLSLKSSKVSSLPSKMGAKDGAPLRVMLLGKCRDLTKLDGAFLSHFTNLCVLDVSWASSLSSLPRALGKLRELVLLNLQSSGIESLPKEISKLCKLEYLNLQDCNRLTSLPGRALSKLVSLKYLNTRGCGLVWRNAVGTGKIFALMQRFSWGDHSESFTHLTALCSLVNLQKLWMGSNDLELLPDKVMGELSELRLVSLRFPNLKELPAEMCKLIKVEILDLNSCLALKELPVWVPDSMEIMKTLDLRQCWGLSQLPSMLGRLQSLVKLELSGCRSLQRIPDEFGYSDSFPSLLELWLFGCTGLKAFPELQAGAFPKLFNLNLFDCSALQAVPTSIRCLGQKLRILNLGGCRQLVMPSNETLAAFVKLEELNLKGMPIKTIPSALVSLPSLKKLTISGCSLLQTLPEHGTANNDGVAQGSNVYFPNLQELIAANATSLTGIPMGIMELPKLKRLDVTNCDSLVVTDEIRNTIASRFKGLHIKGL